MESRAIPFGRRMEAVFIYLCLLLRGEDETIKAHKKLMHEAQTKGFQASPRCRVIIGVEEPFGPVAIAFAVWRPEKSPLISD
jgi:hypothetical protein